MPKTLQLEQAWWKKNKAATLKSTGLGAVLGEYEKVKARVKKIADSNHGRYIADDPKAFDEAKTLLGKTIPTAVKKAEGMCNKTLHKDTLAILGSAASVLNKEVSAIDKMKADWEKKYQSFRKTILDPSQKRVTLAESLKEAAHTEYKNAEALNKKFSQAANNIAMTMKKGSLSDDKAKQAVGMAHQFASTIEKLHAKISGMFEKVEKFRNDNKASLGSDLIPADRKTYSEWDNAIGTHAHRVGMYRDKVGLMVKEANANVRQIKESLQGVTERNHTLKKSIDGLKEALTLQQQSSRKLCNDIVGMVQAVRAMVQKPEFMESQGITPDQFKKVCAQHLKNAEGIRKKVEKIADQAVKSGSKVIDRIPQTTLAKSDFKEIHKDIQEQMKLLLNYPNSCDGYIAEIKQLQKKIK